MGTQWPLTGRAEELHALDNLLAQGGEASGVVVAGLAGVGKSRLVREALDRLETEGWTARWLVATRSAQQLPLGALADWVGEPGGSDLALVRGAINTLASGAEPGRLVIGVDDVHLLDDLSAHVLHQLFLRRGARVMLTLRHGEPVPDAVQSLWKEHRIARLELQPLSHGETVEVVCAALGGPLDPLAGRRLWQLTDGNLLYLRHLVDQEVAAGRLVSDGSTWQWVGEPKVSPGLVELVEARMGALPADVVDLLDALAVSEPLPLDILGTLATPDTLEDAESRGLVAVDGAEARVAHPLYGEIRRIRAGTTRLRRIRGLVARALARQGSGSAPEIVRRATLTLESDLPPDPDLFLQAAQHATSLADLLLVDRLAAAAIDAGAGPEANYVRAHALSWLSQGEAGDAVMRAVDPTSLTAPEQGRLAFLRATNMLWTLRCPEGAKRHADEAAARLGVDGGSLAAFYAAYWAGTGAPDRAIEAAKAFDPSIETDIATSVMLWGRIQAYADVGLVTEADAAAAVALELVDQSPEAWHMRFVLGDAHLSALIYAGRVREAQSLTEDLGTRVSELPGAAPLFSAALSGRAALAAGQASAAAQLLDIVVGGLSASGETNGFTYRYQLPRIVALALSGNVEAARSSWEQLDTLVHPSWAFLEPERLLAGAWVAAVAGCTTEAIAHAREGAEVARARGQWAQEVCCLQVAAQIGASDVRCRLEELGTLVGGPRADLATRLAGALAGRDADRLAGLADELAAAGDRVAAVDAAGQAAALFRAEGRRGSALTAASRAHTLAREGGIAQSPGTLVADMPVELTAREREILAMVAQGLTNRQIAERLCVSVRTVEGHLYRASRRAGISSREELAGIAFGPAAREME